MSQNTLDKSDDESLTDVQNTEENEAKNEYVVSYIKKHRKIKHNTENYLIEFLVVWKNGEKTWEPIENLGCCQKFQEYLLENLNSKNMVKDENKKTIRIRFEENKRLKIIIKQDCCCNLCYGKLDIGSFEIDHIIPLELGGSNQDINLQALCPKCHIFKTSCLDKDVIPMILQSTKSLDPNEKKYQILKRCQFIYNNRFCVNFTKNDIFNHFTRMTNIYMKELNENINEKIEKEKNKFILCIKNKFDKSKSNKKRKIS